GEPFEFLGFTFQHEHRWRYDGPAGPRRVRELGWKDADRTPSPLALPLPGEVPAAGAEGALVLGPGVERLDVAGDAIEVSTPDRGDLRRVPLAGVDRLIVLGPAGWTADAPGKLLRAGVPVQFVSEGGWPLGELAGEVADDPDALAAQCRAAADPAAALRIAKPLVRAKLTNFAALLASATDAGAQGAAVGRLRELARESADAATLDALRGAEGAGAADWYRCLPGLLGSGFRFARRVSPDADDPVNVLLNIGHTVLHRHAAAACRAAGLSPAVGFLHRGTGRFAALAADLQEPFRHLVERAVIVATRRLRPAQFLARADGAHRLVLDANAARSFHALLQRTLRAGAAGRGQTEPRSWLAQLLTTARGLRRHLLDPAAPWEPFEHP
ncbi:MAG: CRISPR-associated endonuclease Cas1, partial [Planctomycetes bacterium]|nr:CRISPR-associated endonuclease Cas1 [Planctomycetota bacterium]